MKPKIYHLELFHVEIYYFYGWSRAAYANYLKKHLGTSDDVEGFSGSTMHLHIKNSSDVITVWTDKKDASILAHECVHAANLTMKASGVKVSVENDELQAYLVQLLVAKGLE